LLESSMLIPSDREKENPLVKADATISNEETKPLRDILEGFLFYVGIPALTLYPLGFVALCLQMWRDQLFPYSWDFGGFNFGMTWYAASLVPKVVVIGMGVRLLFVSLLACALGMGIAWLTSNFLHRWWRVRGRWYLVESWKEQSKWEILFWRLSFVTLLPLVVYLVWSDFRVDSWYDAPFLAAFVVFSAAAGATVVYARHRDRGRRLLHGLAAAYAGTLLAALSLSPLQFPDLPLVEFDSEQGARFEAPSGEPFVMLYQAAGYWHVYNRTSGLVSIPDDEAKIVRHWDDQSVDKPDSAAERDNRSYSGDQND
jgi:hypothetical protein